MEDERGKKKVERHRPDGLLDQDAMDVHLIDRETKNQPFVKEKDSFLRGNGKHKNKKIQLTHKSISKSV
jgi:hypothetical protein